jgi:hypothetical protein
MDLGATSPLLLEMPRSVPAKLALALGKDGFAYLLDAQGLGGVASGGGDTAAAAAAAEGVPKVQVATRNIGGAAASYAVGPRTFVVLDAQTTGQGQSCPAGQSGDLVALEIKDGAPPTIETRWCASNQGHGVPAVTTIDGANESIVWVTSDGSARLYAYDGETGALLWGGGDDTQAVAGTNRFNTVIAVHDRVLVAGDDGLFAFTP